MSNLLRRRMMMAYANSSNSGGGGGTGGGIGADGMTLALDMNTYQLGEPTWVITFGLDINCPVPLPCDVELEICFDEDVYGDGPYHLEWITLEAGKTAWSFEFTFGNYAISPQTVYASVRNMNILGDRKGYRIVPSHLYAEVIFINDMTRRYNVPALLEIFHQYNGHPADEDMIPICKIALRNWSYDLEYVIFRRTIYALSEKEDIFISFIGYYREIALSPDGIIGMVTD